MFLKIADRLRFSALSVHAVILSILQVSVLDFTLASKLYLTNRSGVQTIQSNWQPFLWRILGTEMALQVSQGRTDIPRHALSVDLCAAAAYTEPE